MVLVSIPKNWKVAPRTRISAVWSANRANASAVRQPRMPAVQITILRPARLASSAAAQAPSSEPMFMIIV